MLANTNYHVRNYYEGREYDLSLTHGTERVSMALRPKEGDTAYGVNFPTDQARAIAADILRRVDEVERNRPPDLAGQHADDVTPEHAHWQQAYDQQHADDVTVTLTRDEAQALHAAGHVALAMVEPRTAADPGKTERHKAAGLSALVKLQAARA